MKRNNFFSRFIVVTLTAALLLISGSRAIRVSALADTVEAVAPVFDTQIIQLADYIDHGGMTDPQLDIFYFLAGALAVGQLGAQDAKLVSPYPNETSVKEWFINCGIQLYNTLIGLVPSGDYYVGIDYPTRGIKREEIKALVAALMGDAVVAANYTDLDDYLEDNPEHLFIPFTPDLQLGVNAVLGLNGGANDWQFRPVEWLDYNYSWQTRNMSGVLSAEYNTEVDNLTNPKPCYLNNNSDVEYMYNYVASLPSEYKFHLYINTNSQTVGFVNNLGQYEQSFYSDAVFVRWQYDPYVVTRNDIRFEFPRLYYNPNNFDNFIQLAKSYINNLSTWPSGLAYSDYNSMRAYFFPIDFFSGDVYVGSSWESRQLLEALDDLNYQVEEVNYYQRVQNDYLLDIIGLIDDLTGTTDILTQIKDNLYDLTGQLVLSPKFINVSVDLPDLSLLVDPPVPVNLNDIAELTDNSYLERVKEEAARGGNALAYLVAFWHNCDAELIYVLFGAGITVLVGAFVGKWGHS